MLLRMIFKAIRVDLRPDNHLYFECTALYTECTVVAKKVKYLMRNMS